ncbi:FkbM family methyltransferase [Ectothiorhodospira lacustris]|uniref:FkbM family methyltransferase n=1 Tax=Ectothiorhodospira lacustris TaxID=2899127 RepID=UPI001EE7DCD8|nr:FkbM family methyltransferase [Ectothiorhodospira lacustris]MCG5510659.1 FkbM family methyltransferase [Ectothiorhodospira lacustris]MCG5522441.1 FkbM family methyltransferase [Ectothiorhodospira lacustris]
MFLDKAIASDFRGRYREIVSDPLNLLIRRVPNAGFVVDGHVVMHNGLLMPLSGDLAYYKQFSDILVINRGVHEPLEEFCFQSLLDSMKVNGPVMLELGAYWGHYSSWFKCICPDSRVILVEPDENNFMSGCYTFNKNALQGEFIRDFVGKDSFTVDKFLVRSSIDKLDLLHADIQGYELEMLDGASKSLHNGSISYVMVSTHSERLHSDVLLFLERCHYRIEVSSSFEWHSTSYDGFIFASHVNAKRVFTDLMPLGRVEIAKATPSRLVDYVSQLKKAIRHTSSEIS